MLHKILGTLRFIDDFFGLSECGENLLNLPESRMQIQKPEGMSRSYKAEDFP